LRHNTANRAVPQHGPAPLDLESSSQHRRQHAIGRPVSVQEGLDIDDHLLAHVDTAFECGRAHVRQQYDLAYACELDQLRIDGRLVLENIEARAGDLAGGDQAHQGLSSLSTVAPSARRRGTARMSAMVISAVSSVRTPGVLVTVMPRLRTVATSMWSTPLP